MKNFLHGLGGVALVGFGVWLTVQTGYTPLTPICAWLGLAMFLSIQFRLPRLNRALLLARIGLAFNVIAYLAMVVWQRAMLYEDWIENAQAVQFHTWLQWLATPVGTGFDTLVIKNNWGIYLFPEYSSFCLALTFFGNLVVHVLLSILLLTGLAALFSRGRE